jgi:alkyl hydroperoxide reductase subunit AhpC
MSKQIEVTPAEVAAARLQIVVDEKLGRRTSEVVRKIAAVEPGPAENGSQGR